MLFGAGYCEQENVSVTNNNLGNNFYRNFFIVSSKPDFGHVLLG